MCKNCKEKFIEQSGKTMLICKLLERKEKTDMRKLCICQRFCPDRDKYVAYNQKTGCKNYE